MQNRHQFDRMRNEMSHLPTPSLSLLFPHECLKILFVPNFLINNCENRKRMRFGCRCHLHFHFIATKQWNKINMNAITAFFVCVLVVRIFVCLKNHHTQAIAHTPSSTWISFIRTWSVCVCGLPPLYNVKNKNCDNNISNNNNMS